MMSIPPPNADALQNAKSNMLRVTAKMLVRLTLLVALANLLMPNKIHWPTWPSETPPHQATPQTHYDTPSITLRMFYLANPRNYVHQKEKVLRFTLERNGNVRYAITNVGKVLIEKTAPIKKGSTLCIKNYHRIEPNTDLWVVLRTIENPERCQ